MVNILYEGISKDTLQDWYKAIYNFISVTADENDIITNVHSSDEVGYPGSVYNITFDYDNDIRVVIHILDNCKIHIEAPDDMITGTESLILGEFPELIDSFE